MAQRKEDHGNQAGRGIGPALAVLQPVLVHAGLISLAINLLLLVPALYMLQVFDRVLTSRSLETLTVLSVAVGGALLTMALLDYLRARLLVAAGIALDRMLAGRVLAGLLDEAARRRGGAAAQGLRDLSTLRGFLAGAGIFAVFDAPWLPIYLLIIFAFHPVLGTLATGGAVLMVALALLNERLARRPVEDFGRSSRLAASYLDAGLRNAEVVRALGMASGLTERWQRLNGEALEHQARSGRVGAGVGATTKFVRQAIQIVLLAAGAYLVVRGHVTAGAMIAATVILGRALQPVELLIAGWKNLVEARAAYARLDELLSGPPAAAAPTALPEPSGALDVERLVFAVDVDRKVILKGVSFSLPAGESLGLIGPSAAGKSTLARLIVGAWTPVSGTVRLDGADLALWPREALGDHLGYLPQDVELFAGTVAENIARLAAPDSDAVVAAARRAHAHDMILRLPRGYDTEIGDAGLALSAGPRQRVALARALYGRPKLVVLDEPNANLDAEGEQALIDALQGLRAERVTTIVITHRPALLVGVDKVLVLQDGAVEQFGPRAQVVRQAVRAAANARPA